MKNLHTFESFLNEAKNMKWKHPNDPNTVSSIRAKLKGKKIKAYKNGSTELSLGKHIELGTTIPIDSKAKDDVITVNDVELIGGRGLGSDRIIIKGLDSLGEEWHVTLSMDDGNAVVELA